jgi:uncharacterized protein DUF3667
VRLLGRRDSSLATLRTSNDASDAAVSWKVKCLNCGAALVGPFCAECGQRAVPPHPTITELAGDAITEFTGWDGKFADTIRTLVTRPGELTRQWLAGRRAHFISPLRLYLTASLVFFVLQSGASRTIVDSSNLTGGLVVSMNTKGAPRTAAVAANKAMTERKPLTPAERDSAMRSIGKAPRILKPMLVKMIDDPMAIQNGLRQMFPRMLFALLPLYAGILALFYHRRHYPEHLYFAIHLHSFVFIAMMMLEISKFLRINAVSAAVGLICLFWVMVYSLFALRRVYGGGWFGTIVKGAAIMTLYGVIALPVMFLTMLLAAF